MRRAIPLGLAGVALLLLLGVPFLGVRWGFPDDRVLPKTASAHQVGDQLRQDFAKNSDTAVTIVIPDTDGLSPNDIERLRRQSVSRARRFGRVRPDGHIRRGQLAGPPSAPTGRDRAAHSSPSTARLRCSPTARRTSSTTCTPSPTPAGKQVDMTGTAQMNRDSVDAITSTAADRPRAHRRHHVRAAVPVDRQHRMPLKALVLNVLSLTATFGAMVWIFQDGHLGALGTTPSGTLVANVPVLLFCIAFGLSMDYEVFLVSRIREFWLASGQDQSRQRRERGPRHRPHRSDHHRRRADHVGLVRGTDRRQRVVHADVRPRADTGRPG